MRHQQQERETHQEKQVNDDPVPPPIPVTPFNIPLFIMESLVLLIIVLLALVAFFGK
jgi:hypothetical protein